MAKRSIIITGAAGGIGLACAKRFAEAGDHVVLVDTDEDAGAEALDALAEFDVNKTFVHADTSSRLDVHNVLAEALETNGGVDVLINAELVYFSADFLETSEEDFRRVVEQNLTAAFFINQAVAKQMVTQIKDADIQIEPATTYGIINVGSVDSIATRADQVAFAASIGGLHQLSKSVALALSPHNIRVNTIGVGLIRGERGSSDAETSVPLDRVGEPSDVANMAFFLTSEDASFVTGQTVYVDGGQLTRRFGEIDKSKKKSPR